MIADFKYRPVLLIVSFLATLFFGESASGQASNTAPQILRLGYSSLIFQDIDPRDGNAALLAYAKQIEKRFFEKKGTVGKLEAKLYQDTNEILEALRRNEVHILSVPSDQFLELNSNFELEPCLATTSQNNKFSQFVLIVSAKSNINKLEDLQSRTIALLKNRHGWLNEKWLDLLLLKRNLGQKEQVFQNIIYLDKESSIVYDVYFKKADCGLVRKSVLTTLEDLNPQLAKNIKVLENSEPLVTQILAYNKSSNQSLIKTVIQESSELHLTKEGKLILGIFKATSIEKITSADLLSVKRIVDQYNALLKKYKARHLIN